jgi:hypothetical protein
MFILFRALKNYEFGSIAARQIANGAVSANIENL